MLVCFNFFMPDHPRYVLANAGCKHFDAYGGPESIPQSRFSFNAKVLKLQMLTHCKWVYILSEDFQLLCRGRAGPALPHTLPCQVHVILVILPYLNSRSATVIGIRHIYPSFKRV